jgi:hypothetical protein
MTRALLPTMPGAAPRLGRRERDFLLLNIFVLLQHGYAERASVLADAMHFAGENDTEVHLARAVLRFARRQWEAALESLDHLDRIDPIERFGAYRLDERQRMRRYLKTRCFFELGESTRMRDALDSYLRHGADAPRDAG